MVKIKKFTGWHMTAILVSFFLIVITVNLIMARAAIGTFGGTVVDNSYVAGQKFDGWAARARDQERWGWSVATALDADRHVRVVATDAQARRDGFTVTATAHHPLGRAPEQQLRFVRQSDGALRAAQALPAGRWQVRVSVSHGSRAYQRLIDVQ